MRSGALLACSAWMSVLHAMKSTRSSALAIIVFTALQPAPPTPTTRILAACLLCSKVSMGCLDSLLLQGCRKFSTCCFYEEVARVALARDNESNAQSFR